MGKVIYRVKLVTSKKWQICGSDNDYYVNFVLAKKSKICYVKVLTSSVTRVTISWFWDHILSLHRR